MVYIADCYTFKRNVDLECFNLDRERNKMVDTLLALLDFKWRFKINTTGFWGQASSSADLDCVIWEVIVEL